jgi:hypothetical protein
MEDRPPRLSSTTLAGVISIAGHPFVLVPLMVAIATGNWIWTAVVTVGTILPLFVIIVRKVRSGLWSDHDVSRRDQRGGLYRVALPLIAASAVLLYLLGAGRGMLRGVAAAAVMLAIGFLLNRFLKISLHMMVAANCGVTIGWLHPHALYAIVPFIAAIGWARRKLDRHTWLEIVLGTLIGGAAAVWAMRGSP